MGGSTTRIASQTHEVTRVRIPGQDPKPVRDAFDTARELGGSLASFGAVIFNVQRTAARRDYLLAADPINLPKQEGWYLVEQNVQNMTITFHPIDRTEAESLRDEGRMFEVLRVSGYAVSAAAEQRPVDLGFYYQKGKWFLGADCRSDRDALVVLDGEVGGVFASQEKRVSVPKIDFDTSQKAFQKIARSLHPDLAQRLGAVYRRAQSQPEQQRPASET